MTRAPLPLRLLPLCIATLLALAPLAALAQANDPLGATIRCFDALDVAPALSLNEPNDPNAVFFSHLRDCATLCKKAGLSCAKFVKRAVTCELRLADDRARFKVRTECEGLTLKDCTADDEIEAARALQRETASGKLAPALSACALRATSCAGKCDATP